MTEGTILHLQRLSTEDGPGIRTTVFFKGCPLRCAWCHNPESIALHPQVQWLENRCIACQTCIKACPNQCLTWTEHGAERDRSTCRLCGTCVDACPANAHEMLGQKISVSSLVKELIKDRVFYEKSGGGVTLSGGEPTLQPDFALALLQALHHHNISTCLDTCGQTQLDILLQLAAESDWILYDLKLIDAQAHRHFTGVENQRIFNNLLALGEFLAAHPTKRLWIRTPLIPNTTDTKDNITGIGRWLADHILERLSDQIERWELCAFNNLCRDKYTRLGLTWTYAETPLLSQDRLYEIQDYAAHSGFTPERIFITGAARAENKG